MQWGISHKWEHMTNPIRERVFVKKSIYIVTITVTLLAAANIIMYRLVGADTMLSLAITFGTVAYHFLIRLAVGALVTAIMGNKADYTKRWYRCRSWEMRLYNWMKVRRWKRVLPTFQSDYFDNKKHSWDEIAQAMCQAEVVHEIIFILSFVPILFSIWFGALPVFLITSFFAAAFDLMFVIIQRYNRPRVIKVMDGLYQNHGFRYRQ